MSNKANTADQKPKRGGHRDGSGRPRLDRKNAISVRISDESLRILNLVSNKSEFIDKLIKENKANVPLK